MYVAIVSNLSRYSASLIGKDCCSRCVHITFKATSVFPGKQHRTFKCMPCHPVIDPGWKEFHHAAGRCVWSITATWNLPSDYREIVAFSVFVDDSLSKHSSCRKELASHSAKPKLSFRNCQQVPKTTTDLLRPHRRLHHLGQRALSAAG